MTYLDNASTTQTKFFAKDYYIFGNPNSSHDLGLKANEALDEAREIIKRALGVKSGKVLFCRCATEAVEWLCSAFNKVSGGKCAIICSNFEHESVSIASDWTEREAPLIVLNENDLFLHQYVNQMTGTVHDIESIGKQMQSTGAFFGSDFTAAIGHAPIPKNLDTFCDAVWMSGHKMYAEQGIGAIWLSDRLFNYLYGEKDSRNSYGLLYGTPNVSGAIAMSYALEHAVKNFVDNVDKYSRLTERLVNSLTKSNIEFHIVDADKPRTNAINAFTLPGINADALATFLSSRGIYIGVGHSACSDEADYRVLEAFGLSKKEASETVRISFCEDNTVEDVDAFVEGVKEFKKMFM